MNDNLKIFRSEFLNANTWAQRKEGVPLDLLDNLTEDELKIAEKELIEVLSVQDDWPILGLGHIKSKIGLSKLYELLPLSKKGIKIAIAHSIYQICADKEMIEIALTEIPKISNQYELIEILYLLNNLPDDRIKKTLNAFREHKEYLVAYNATRVLGFSTDKVVEKFRNKKNST